MLQFTRLGAPVALVNNPSVQSGMSHRARLHSSVASNFDSTTLHQAETAAKVSGRTVMEELAILQPPPPPPTESDSQEYVDAYDKYMGTGPIYKRWQFWVGVGIFSIAAYAIVNRRSARPARVEP